MSGPLKPRGRHPEKKLTAAEVRNQRRPGFYADGHGLYLKVDLTGSKRWVQRLVVQGKRRDLGLGSASIVGLADARERALNNRKLARSGQDPLAAQRQLKAIPTFELAAKTVHGLFRPNWRNDKHGKQWLETLQSYAVPHFGSKRVNLITSADILQALTPIWNERPETARRVKQRIGTVLKWSVAQGWRTDNPAEAVSKALPKHDLSNIVRRKALDYRNVKSAIETVQRSNASQATKLAFEFLIHTATRSGETRGAKWNEINFEKAEWIIPKERMKAKRAHRIPLSPSCLHLLKQASQLNDEAQADSYVFTVGSDGRPLSDMTLSKLMKDLAINAVPHGFRSSFRDWAGEQTNFPREVCEFALAHVIKDKSEAAYARSDLFEKRKMLMVAWSSFLSLPALERRELLAAE